MATGPNFLINTRSETSRMLDLLEEAQGIAARLTQETVALGGGAAATSGVTWGDQDITQQQFFDGLTSLAAMSDILAAHKTNLYRLKV